jgi:hypothetical protein
MLALVKTCILQKLQLNLVCFFLEFEQDLLIFPQYRQDLRLYKINKIEGDIYFIVILYQSILHISFIFSQTGFF